METGEDGIKLMHYFEQCRLKAYKPIPSDPWTCGWGCTGKDSDGNVIDENTVWTQEKADYEFAYRLHQEFEPGVTAALKTGASQNEFDAMECLAFNIGIGNFLTSSVLRLHNQGNGQGAADAFRLWNKAAGRVMKGLQRRREAEMHVYLGMDAEQAIDAALKAFP